MTAESVRLIETGLDLSIHSVQAVGGGCVASASRLETSRGRLFAKEGTGVVARTLEAEAVGLRALSSVTAGIEGLVTPEVLTVTAPGDRVALVLQWVEAGSPAQEDWERFGGALAEMHQASSRRFGFDTDNWIGATPQENGWMEEWPSFFLSRRLDPQIKRARAAGLWRTSWDVPISRLCGSIHDVLPDLSRGGLLHGDLWSGNAMFDLKGFAVLIDPAVYFGDGWSDIAMAQLFGGFSPRFFSAYAEACGGQSDTGETILVYQLYHMLNHLNLFGSGYSASVERILRALKV